MSVITCVTGTKGAGKTSFVIKTLKKNKAENTSLVLYVGEICRSLFQRSQNRIQECENQTTPAVTEMLVRDLVKSAIRTATESSMDLIIDGFPRSRQQVLCLNSWVNYYLGVERVNLVLVYTEEATIQIERVEGRGDRVGEELNRMYDTLGRLERDAEQITKVVESFKSLCKIDERFIYNEVNNT